MQLNLSNILKHGETIAVAVSGGCDSMVLLDYLHSNAHLYSINVIALNVEHGIRGESSVADTNFVKDYCAKHSIQLLTYSVDSLKKAEQDKISVEQSARILRYECFADAISTGKCDKVATAHHADDNTESVLFNLFRGTGLSGLRGIKKEREDKIIRPFLTIDRVQIENYALERGIPYVTDQTNLLDDYTRNAIRLNVIPKIKEIFPSINKSLGRLTDTVAQDDDFIWSIALNQVSEQNGAVKIALPNHPAVISRAVIRALNLLGVEKDWEKTHIDSVINLSTLENGSKVNLLDQITAIKEYDGIAFYRKRLLTTEFVPFSLGCVPFNGVNLQISMVENSKIDLCNGFYADLNKIPKNAVIRTKQNGDLFTKFGGGTKSLGDYLTDKKIPQRLRDNLPLLAVDNTVLAIFDVAISDKIKVDKTTKTIIKLN